MGLQNYLQNTVTLYYSNVLKMFPNKFEKPHSIRAHSGHHKSVFLWIDKTIYKSQSHYIIILFKCS